MVSRSVYEYLNRQLQTGHQMILYLCDDMKVKDGPVHDINAGRLVGYTDIESNKDIFLNVLLLVTAMYTWAAAATAINGLNRQPKTDIRFNEM